MLALPDVVDVRHAALRIGDDGKVCIVWMVDTAVVVGLGRLSDAAELVLL